MPLFRIDPEKCDRDGICVSECPSRVILLNSPNTMVHGSKDWPFGSTDGALALSHLDLYASSLGLGTCWGGYLYTAANNHPPLFKAMGLPENHRAYGAMMVGYPKFKYPRIPRRKPPRIEWV